MLIFNNVDLSNYLTVNSVSGRGIASYDLDLISVKGRDGAYLAGKRRPYRTIKVSYTIPSKDAEELRLHIDILNDILGVEEPVPITFLDEPNMTYYGILENSSEGREFVRWGQGTLSFLCPDPYKYGPEKSYLMQDAAIVTNEGTAEADPIFTMQVKEPTTFAMISNGADYMMVGQPAQIDDTPFQKYERIFFSNANNMTGWTTHNVVDGGIVSGEMETTGNRFQALNYGSGSGWHGPAIKTSLPETLDDFRFTTFLSMFNSTPSQVGRIEIYLLDTTGNAVAKIAMKDVANGRALGFGEARVGSESDSHFLIAEAGDRDGNWNNFSGHMRIEREGNKWTAYFAKVDTDTGRHHTRRSVTWVDRENKYTGRVAQIAIHMGAHDSNVPVIGGVYSVNMFKINKQDEGIPYIADVDDEIEFNHVTGDARINGESVPFDFGGDFFKLSKGQNGLAVLPEGTFETGVRFRERYR